MKLKTLGRSQRGADKVKVFSFNNLHIYRRVGPQWQEMYSYGWSKVSRRMIRLALMAKNYNGDDNV